MLHTFICNTGSMNSIETGMCMSFIFLIVNSIFLIFSTWKKLKFNGKIKFFISSTFLLISLLTFFSWIIFLITLYPNIKDMKESVHFSRSFILAIISSLLSFIIAIILSIYKQVNNNNNEMELNHFEKESIDIKLYLYPIGPFLIFIHSISLTTSFWYKSDESHLGLFKVFGKKTNNFPGISLLEKGM